MGGETRKKKVSLVGFVVWFVVATLRSTTSQIRRKEENLTWYCITYKAKIPPKKLIWLVNNCLSDKKSEWRAKKLLGSNVAVFSNL